jgi:hypothetical protein
MPKKRIFFGSVIALLLIAIACGYYLYNKPHQSAAGETSAVSVSAESLYTAYQQDEHAADQQYLGKVIEVKGALSEIQHNGALEIWVLSSKKTGGNVNCQMFSAGKDSSANPKSGQMVTVKGKCTGFLMDVNLVDCIVK